MSKKQFITTICIDNDRSPFDDKAWLDIHALKPTNLLRKKIKEMRKEEEGQSTNEEMAANLKKLSQNQERFFKFLGEKGLVDEFLKE